ncbi:MAG: hybrid sensor histidine kinase/response regulator [Desulfobacula sp. RIFOXYA12_FULL_46_16]|nr:MAG: hybrid sensor histidine kinase/response regulator [Deltaproteobacteria bacterium RIFOXYC2_FULL_48_10]OGR21002.1 MAG: hybrid sensor histidine kinase/response regulator [Desulfobacula sp. RIFOXYA12_FULL_46_16]OGR39911.1 MAG: hybrid sensor histidine kinase/response regulator [Desulfobacula sp. RIFOXYB2_FULL_45_6]
MTDPAAKKILVIDDEEYIRDSVIGFLEDFGFEVVDAENGKIGLEIFDSRQPDLVLCDLRMPEMDGLEVLASVRRKNSEIPIIIVSGAGNIADTVEALRLGAWDYIIKPIQDMNVLYHAVHKALERAELIREKYRYEKDLEIVNGQLRLSLETLEKTRDQLVQSEKMAALGELVAGVAHEINTPVGVGVTAASFLDAKTNEVKKIYEAGELKRSELENYLQTVEEVSNSILINMERAAELVSSFKQVAVDQSSENRRQFNLKEYINEILLSLRPRYKKTEHTIEVSCEDDIELNSFPGAFSQILNNLIMNSLIHGFREMEKGTITVNISRQEKNILFVYRDNGRGMGPEEREKVFDPFYTTMRGKGGTGLGMSIVFNLITQTLKGGIECESSPGKGVVFTMTFPEHLENI